MASCTEGLNFAPVFSITFRKWAWSPLVFLICLLPAVGHSAESLVDRLQNSNATPTPFPSFSENRKRLDAFNAIKSAMAVRKSRLTALDLTNGRLSQAREILSEKGLLTAEAVAILAEMQSWVAMKQDVINFFGQINTLLNSMNTNQLATIDTIYDRLTLDYPPEFKVNEALGQVYLDMLFGIFGSGASLIGGSNVDSQAFAGGAIGSALGIINMAISAANDIKRIENEQRFALESKDKVPLQLHKARLKDAISERFGLMHQRNQEVRDRLQGDYALLQAFSRKSLLDATDQRHIVDEYSRAFAKQMWLFFLNENTTFETVLLAPKLLETCNGSLKTCATGNRKRSANFKLAQDEGLVAIGYMAVKRLVGCSSSGATETLQYGFRIGRQRRSANLSLPSTALDGSTMAQIFKSGVTRQELVRIIGEASFSDAMEARDLKTCNGGRWTKKDKVLGTELLIDELHSDILKFADITEINLKHTSRFPPALETFTPVGETKPHLFLAYHGPTENRSIDRDGRAIWDDTIYLTDSPDGERWSAAKPGWGFWEPVARHIARTGPALLRLHNRLLITYGSARPGNGVYGYFIDGSTYREIQPEIEAQFGECKLSEVSADTEGALLDLDGTYKKYICNDKKIKRLRATMQWDAYFNWEMEPGVKTRVKNYAGGESNVELIDAQWLARPSRAATTRPLAATRTMLADRGPAGTNNAARLVFVDAEDGLQMIQGDFDRFSCWGCYSEDDQWAYDELKAFMRPYEKRASSSSQSLAEQRKAVRDRSRQARVARKFKDLSSRPNANPREMAQRLAAYEYEAYERVLLALRRPEPLGETKHTPGVTSHPEWLAIAYLQEPRAPSKKRTLQFLTLSGGDRPANRETIELPNGAEPASGPNLIYDHSRGITFLSVADTKGTLHLLKRQPGDDAWTSLRAIKNETKERPGMAIFEDNVYVSFRRESGQILVAPIYEIYEPRVFLVLPDDPRYSDADMALARTTEDLWDTPQLDKGQSSLPPIGFTGWDFGVPTVGLKQARDSGAAWYTAPTQTYPNSNQAKSVLVSPTVSLPPTDGNAEVMLVFEHWLRVSDADGSGGRVSFAVEYPNGLGDYQPLSLLVPEHNRGQPSGTAAKTLLSGTAGAWQQVTAFLPSQVHGQSIRLKFEFDDEGDGLTQNGWIIDNLTMSVQ